MLPDNQHAPHTFLNTLTLGKEPLTWCSLTVNLIYLRQFTWPVPIKLTDGLTHYSGKIRHVQGNTVYKETQ